MIVWVRRIIFDVRFNRSLLPIKRSAGIRHIGPTHGSRITRVCNIDVESVSWSSSALHAQNGLIVFDISQTDWARGSSVQAVEWHHVRKLVVPQWWGERSRWICNAQLYDSLCKSSSMIFTPAIPHIQLPSYACLSQLCRSPNWPNWYWMALYLHIFEI